MASLIRHVVSNYNEVVKNIKDPVIDTWPLMGSPGPILCIVGTYLIFVLKAGPKIMEKKPAFQLNTVMLLYNAFQVLFSIWLASLILDIEFKDLFSFHGCNYHSSPDAEITHVQTVLSRAAWWYFFAKIIELFDTYAFVIVLPLSFKSYTIVSSFNRQKQSQLYFEIRMKRFVKSIINKYLSISCIVLVISIPVFFVLRKKQDQVTFLHVYHHTVTALSSWCYLKLLPGEQGIIVGFLNSVVHIIMYSYYFIAALGSKYKKYLWWKKYMTWIQLLQFGIMLFYLILTLAMDCRLPKVLTYFFIANVIIFIYLFSDFYRKAYKTKTA